jgi:hypothetical protein
VSLVKSCLGDTVGGRGNRTRGILLSNWQRFDAGRSRASGSLVLHPFRLPRMNTVLAIYQTLFLCYMVSRGGNRTLETMCLSVTGWEGKLIL